MMKRFVRFSRLPDWVAAFVRIDSDEIANPSVLALLAQRDQEPHIKRDTCRARYRNYRHPNHANLPVRVPDYVRDFAHTVHWIRESIKFE